MKELLEIQKALKAPKSQYNEFGGYAYRSCEDILAAVKPLLGDVPLTLHDEIVLIGERYYIKATATFWSQPPVETVGWAREAASKKGMDESQITGAASSYARKYALNGLFAIDDIKDADTMGPPENIKGEKGSVGKPETAGNIPNCPKCNGKAREDNKKKGSYYCWVKKGGCGHTWEKEKEPTGEDVPVVFFEEYENRLEAAFMEGKGMEEWQASHKLVRQSFPGKFSEYEQLKDALKARAAKGEIGPGPDEEAF